MGLAGAHKKCRPIDVEATPFKDLASHPPHSCALANGGEVSLSDAVPQGFRVYRPAFRESPQHLPKLLSSFPLTTMILGGNGAIGYV